MSEIRASAGDQGPAAIVSGNSAPQLVVQQVGEATMYFRVSGEALPVANEAAHIKQMYRVGESFVVEYALERLFATTSDEAIVNEMRRRGHTLRRGGRG
jgi:hypothetical protein